MSRYLALDGGDGVGKSTQAKALVSALRERGVEVEHLREPGSTRFSERLREILLDPATGDLDPRTELLAFSAARAQMLEETVRPLLDRGVTIVSERCCVSTLVYQCLASDRGELVRLWQDVSRGLHEKVPIDDLLVLDLPVDVAARRRPDEEDRIEARGLSFHDRVHAGFRRFVEDESLREGIVRRVHRVDASRSIEEVTADLIAALAAGESDHDS